MRLFFSDLLVTLFLVGGSAAPTFGQNGDGAPPAPPAQTLPPIQNGEPPETAAALASPAVTTPPPEADFIVIPLRAHILSAIDLPAVQCGLTDGDIERVVGKVNGIWHKAGIHWVLDPIVHEPAANQARFKTEQETRGGANLGVFKLLAPDESRSEDGINVYYIHAFAANGVFLGDRTAFVQETAKLRAVPGGIDEPLPRVTAHELGHALGLPHRQDRTNLLASGTTGTILNRAEVDRVRGRIARLPGALKMPELRQRLDEARGKNDAAATARLEAILKAIAPEPTAAKS